VAEPSFYPVPAHKLCTILIIIEVALIVVKTFPDMEDIKRLQRIAGKSSKNRTITRLLLKIARLMLKSTIFTMETNRQKKNRWGNPKDLVDILQGEVRKTE
jgi:hypothetical protein